MKKIFCLPLVILASCSGLSGSIEKRQEGKIYLVNKSQNRAYQFTVKKTSVTNDSIYKYETKKITLSPGDEYYMGTEKGVLPTQYPTVEILVLTLYKIVPKKEREKEESRLMDEAWGIVSENNTTSPVPNSKKPYVMLVSKGDILKVENVGDTLINGEKVKYGYTRQHVVDSLHPLPIISYKNKYEVTGQIEFKKAN